MSKSKNWKNGANERKFSKMEKQKLGLWRMLIGSCMQNFRKVAQLEIPKNRGELCMTYISKSKNWKNDENIGNFPKNQKFGF